MFLIDLLENNPEVATLWRLLLYWKRKIVDGEGLLSKSKQEDFPLVYVRKVQNNDFLPQGNSTIMVLTKSIERN